MHSKKCLFLVYHIGFSCVKCTLLCIYHSKQELGTQQLLPCDKRLHNSMLGLPGQATTQQHASASAATQQHTCASATIDNTKLASAFVTGVNATTFRPLESRQLGKGTVSQDYLPLFHLNYCI